MQNLILLLFHTIFSKFQSFIDKRSVCVTDNKLSLLESAICLRLCDLQSLNRKKTSH